MARFVSPDRVSSAPVSLLSDFYREEFTRHRECLKQQREVLLRARDHRCRRCARARLGHLEHCARKMMRTRSWASCFGSSTR